MGVDLCAIPQPIAVGILRIDAGGNPHGAGICAILELVAIGQTIAIGVGELVHGEATRVVFLPDIGQAVVVCIRIMDDQVVARHRGGALDLDLLV